MVKCVIEIALLVVFAVAGGGAYMAGLRGRRLTVPGTGATPKGQAHRDVSLRLALVALLAMVAFTVVVLLWGAAC